MDLEEKTRRLRNYLDSILPGGLEQAADASNPLESLGTESLGIESLGIESLSAEAPDTESSGIEAFNQRAAEANLAASRLAQGQAIDEQQLHSLEAIVQLQYRPALLIQDDSFASPPAPWQHLDLEDNRRRIEQAIPAVGRIEVPNHPSVPYAGTGFVVGHNLLMTNRHVAEIFATGTGTQGLKFKPGQKVGVDFKREWDKPEEVYIRIRKVVLIDDSWDMALLQVAPSTKLPSPLLLSPLANEKLIHQEVVVIGYPAFSPWNNAKLQQEIFGHKYDVKRLQPGKIMGLGKIDSYGNSVAALTHDSSTLGGNSGSAVLHLATGHVVGLHFAGQYLKANYAVPAYALSKDVRLVEMGVELSKSKIKKETSPQRSSTNHEVRPLPELDSTHLAEPLQSTVRADHTGHELHQTVVELNLLNSEGLKAMQTAVMERIRKMIPSSSEDSNPDGEANVPYLFERKSEFSEQYVFANLTTRQIQELLKWNNTEGNPRDRPIYKIWQDFELDLYVDRSSSTVKANAARASFGATGEGIVWAVIDTGVAAHDHFRKHENLCLESLGLSHWDFTSKEPQKLKSQELSDEIGHGTHIAGIIAGETRPQEKDEQIEAVVYGQDKAGRTRPKIRFSKGFSGIAPQCKIVSFKVAGIKQGSPKGRTRDIISALAQVREINGNGTMQRIHGVNISLGHDFDPQWFACGQSPLCTAVNQLVRTGVSVVVAAGNGGYGAHDTAIKGRIHTGIEGSIRDPGNASLAITVGSTHSDMPHHYGVSYFSAKGPTGDGRLKPDMVAPGEKIVSCAAGQWRAETRFDNKEYDFIERSGTSMAAPHVSGCIAAFLSLRREFKSRPERVKEIFLENATDLGRERYYQGYGLVDLMRTIQAV